MKKVGVKLKRRSDSYKILSDCYYLPDEALFKKINSLDASLFALGGETVGGFQTTEEIEALQVDYSALFVGPYGLLAPPYGSLYLENARMLMGESSMDVRRRYTEECLGVNIKEAPDHIAIELEFMYFLIHKEIEATLANAPDAVAEYARKQADFLGTHLCKWLPGFSQKVGANAKTRFYKNLASLTEAFVADDYRSLLAAQPLAFRRETECLGVTPALSKSPSKTRAV